MIKEQAIKHLKLMQSGARNAIRFTKNDKEISEEERKEDIEIYQDQLEALEMAIKALEQKNSDETIKYLECNDIDVQEFIKAMKRQPLQAVNPNSMQLIFEQMNRPTSDDCVSRQAVLNAIIKELCIKDESYLLQSEKVIYNVVKNMPPVTPTHGTCKDCVDWDKEEEYCKHLSQENGWFSDEYYRFETDGDFYCKDFKER